MGHFLSCVTCRSRPASFVYRDLLPVLEAEHHTVLVDDDPLDQSADVLLVKFRERLCHSGKGGSSVTDFLDPLCFQCGASAQRVLLVTQTDNFFLGLV